MLKKKMFLMIAGIKPNELGQASARIEDSRASDGSAGGAHALATGIKPRGNGQGRGDGARGGREAVAVVVVASATAEAISIISSSGLHSPPRSISSNSRKSISGIHRSINRSSSGGRQDTLAGGDYRVFTSVAANSDTSTQSIE